MPAITNELAYVLLIFGLLVAPRALQRFMLPAPLTCFGLGMVAALVLGAVSDDATLSLMATLGISTLFLFAGLEIDMPGLRRGISTLMVHLVLRLATLVAVAWAAMYWLAMPWQTAALLALALLTPSTGFILESLSNLGLDEQEQFWVKTKAIGGELLALAALFVVLQSGSLERLAWSSSALLAMLVFLPLLFLALARIVIPYAPGSEFSLLVMVGLLAAYLTKELGVYYLVGAFVTGLVARALRERMPELASEENLNALKLFASFFVPFYFFYRGMNVPAGAFQWQSLALGCALTAAVVPGRVALVWIQRRVLVKTEGPRSSMRVALALTPTLIFTLVLATIMRERYGLSDAWYGGLLVYAALTTILPPLAMGKSFRLDATEFGTLLAGSTGRQPGVERRRAPANQQESQPTAQSVEPVRE